MVPKVSGTVADRNQPSPSMKTMARISLELGSRGTGHYETLMAIPIDEFIASL